MSLRAPIAVPVEIRAPAGRVFRLAWSVGEDGVRLGREMPFEAGRPVEARFALPLADAQADATALVLRAEVRGAPEGDAEAAERAARGDRRHPDERPTELAFLDPPESARAALRRYVRERLELPELPG